MVCAFFQVHSGAQVQAQIGKVLDLIKVMVKPSEARTSEKSNVYTKEQL